ncbi:MAG: transposase [Bacteroidaceae bacterium]|nr:transposase [Bacteroidaceae bacterium]
MLTREQIEEIQAESQEKGISIKKVLDEKGIPSHQYFWWKKKYARETIPEGFVPVAGGMPPAVMTATAYPGSRGKSKADPASENWMSIELRTIAGTDMRIQGGLTPAMVYTILKSL